MQGHFRRAAPFLLLGLVTSIGVAWNSCLWVPPRSDELWGESGSALACDIQRAFGHDHVLLFHAPIRLGFWPPTADIRTVALPRSLRWSRFDFNLGGHEIVRAGWPMRCLESERRNTAEEQSSPGAGARFWSVRLRDPRPGEGPATLDGTIPLRPLPIGLVANIVLFAAAWALPYFALVYLTPAARRRSRISRGLCPACAYDLRGSQSAKCPECGRACQTAP